jgi:hypothetical protein
MAALTEPVMDDEAHASSKTRMGRSSWRRLPIGVHVCVLSVLICLWASSRAEYYAMYQRPPSPIMHANYYTFHEMSVRLDEGASLGNINITRMVRQTSPYGVYDKSVPPNSTYCDFYTLDPGFAYIVDAARHLFGALPDNYLRTLALQAVADLLGLVAMYTFLLFLGWLPAIVAGALYATNPVLGYVVTVTFYYFWDGIVTILVIGLLVAGTRYLTRRRYRTLGFALLVGMGLILGFGTLLRASWGPYAVVILASLLLFRRTRVAVPIVAVAIAAAAAPTIIRASRAEGHFATSTRMTWHTAHAALGKFPNRLGLEDDDGYQFDLAREKYGVQYNFCSYDAQDVAMRKDYEEVLRDDPQFVVRSVVTRIYENIFWNANENYFPFWNWWLLGFAFVGSVALFLQGGFRQSVAVAAIGLFGTACSAIGFVYYINPNYGNVTQLCLMTLACGVPDIAVRLCRSPRRIQRARHFLRRGRWILLAVGIAYVSTELVRANPTVRVYLGSPRAPEQWIAPEPMMPEDVASLIRDYEALSPTDASRYLAYVRKELPEAPAGPTEAIKAFAARRLKLIRGYRTGIDHPFRLYLDPQAADGAFNAILKSNRAVLGWRAETIVGFRMDDATSWDGRTVVVQLDPKVAGGEDRGRVHRLVDAKFARQKFVRVGSDGERITYRLRP